MVKECPVIRSNSVNTVINYEGVLFQLPLYNIKEKTLFVDIENGKVKEVKNKKDVENISETKKAKAKKKTTDE